MKARASTTASFGALGSLERGLTILELLADAGRMSVPALVEKLNVSGPTVFRTLVVLRSRKYVEHLAKERCYRLGPAVKNLGVRSDNVSLMRLALPALGALRTVTRETVNLARFNGIIEYEEILEGTYSMRMTAAVGEVVPPHATALGKAILAALAPDAAKTLCGPEPYEALTESTITSWARYATELERVRVVGFAEDVEEAQKHVACVAAAVVAADSFPLGAISISGLSQRMRKRDRSRLGQLVKQSCAEISRQLGANHPTTVGVK